MKIYPKLAISGVFLSSVTTRLFASDLCDKVEKLIPQARCYPSEAEGIEFRVPVSVEKRRIEESVAQIINQVNSEMVAQGRHKGWVWSGMINTLKTSQMQLKFRHEMSMKNNQLQIYLNQSLPYHSKTALRKSKRGNALREMNVVGNFTINNGQFQLTDVGIKIEKNFTAPHKNIAGNINKYFSKYVDPDFERSPYARVKKDNCVGYVEYRYNNLVDDQKDPDLLVELLKKCSQYRPETRVEKDIMFDSQGWMYIVDVEVIDEGAIEVNKLLSKQIEEAFKSLKTKKKTHWYESQFSQELHQLGSAVSPYDQLFQELGIKNPAGVSASLVNGMVVFKVKGQP